MEETQTLELDPYRQNLPVLYKPNDTGAEQPEDADANSKRKKLDKKEEKGGKNLKRNFISLKKKQELLPVLFPDHNDVSELNADERSYYDFITSKFPYICQMQMPLTYHDFHLLLQLYGYEICMYQMNRLENYVFIYNDRSADKAIRNRILGDRIRHEMSKNKNYDRTKQNPDAGSATASAGNYCG